MIIWRIRDLATRVGRGGLANASGRPRSMETNPQVDELLSPWPSGIIRLTFQIRSGRGRCAHLVRRHVRVMSFRVKPEASGENLRSRAKWPLICVAFLLMGLAIGLYRTPPVEGDSPNIGNALPAGMVAGQRPGGLIAGPSEGEDAPPTDPDFPARNPDASVQYPDASVRNLGALVQNPGVPIEDPVAPAQSPDAPASAGQVEEDGDTPKYPAPQIRLTTYTVRPGDTLSAIASKFNTSTSSIAHINGLSSADLIRAGMELSVIENASGTVVKVSQGDTLWDISRRYGVSIPEIAQANNLDVAEVLKVGTTLILPGASLRAVPSVSRSSSFRWPIQGSLTSSYGWRTHPITGQESFHEGLDIAAGNGTPIGAAAGGKVKFAGWYAGYGRLVIIDHGDGLETRYGHMSSISVSAGEVVSAGDTIGHVGQSGDATGPHVHFEIRKNGRTLDPRDYLP
jgi:murein DD-endopeptidase MepM/ murein hydrolase activator NlpD